MQNGLYGRSTTITPGVLTTVGSWEDGVWNEATYQNCENGYECTCHDHIRKNLHDADQSTDNLTTHMMSGVKSDKTLADCHRRGPDEQW